MASSFRKLSSAIFLAVSLFVFAAPLASAQSSSLASGIDSVSEIVTKITGSLVSALGQLALAAGVVAFLYGVVQYIWGQRQGDASKTKVGASFMLWGLIGLFTMFSVYGIIKFAQRTAFGVDYKNVNTIEIPEFNLIKKGQSTNQSSPGVVPGGTPPASSPGFLPGGVGAQPY